MIVEVDGRRLQLEAVVNAAVERLRSSVALRLALSVATLEALSFPALICRCVTRQLILIDFLTRLRLLSWAANLERQWLQLWVIVG